ncbi:hypothetical protein [Clostridium sp. UBA5712]|uniref:hypothetical protein n=1 Tax=Clostridium sp. UBA5712 TaxID=1946368 RepID=UPI0032172C62
MNINCNNKDIFLYHGTERQRGNKIICNKKMEESIGDHHWLGDGAYFYEQLFFSYKWIKDMFKSKQNVNHKTFKELASKYMILSCKIRVNEERIFDIDNNIEHKYIFDRFSERIQEGKSYSERLKTQTIADGVVLNVMFSEYKYMNKYDLVIASFKRNNFKYKNSRTRLNYVLEKQICVKNLKVVYDIIEKDFENEYDNLYDLMKEYSNREQQNRVSYNKRKANPHNVYFKGRN